MRSFLIFLISPLIICLSNEVPQNPVIGIYTQTRTNTSTVKNSYIAASYVKFLEMAGAQVVPIFSFSETSEVLGVVRKVNGVLFPGGQMEINMENQWTINADAILKYAIEENEKGNHFPIFGTCLGLELLAFLTTEYNYSISTRVNYDDAIIHPITIKNDGELFQFLTPNLREKITQGNGLFYFNHFFAISIDTYSTNPFLMNFWSLIAIAKTEVNETFVAVMQSKKYPFYGLQFHPEKNPFEWKIFADRSYEGIQVSQMLANRFVNMARKNSNKFDSASEVSQARINNYEIMTPSSTSSYTQLYIFDEIPR